MTDQHHATGHAGGESDGRTPVPIIHHGPVHISGLVSTQQVGAVESSWTTYSVPPISVGVVPVQLLSNDVRRVRALILPLDGDIIVAGSPNELTPNASGNVSATPPNGGYWLKGVPLTDFEVQDLYAVAGSTAAPTRVTVHVEIGYDP